MESVVIIDHGSGNLRSASRAVERAAHDRGLGALKVTVTDDPDLVLTADRVILPGVGAFADCMQGLEAKPGLRAALEIAVMARGRPFLGICVGMQLMARLGHEHGTHEGLGWLDAEVVPLAPADPTLKVPHMGWNDLRPRRSAHPLLDGMADGEHLYFVHSYRIDPADRSLVLASVDYGGEVAAIVGRDNIVGTQFHPEKSQLAGLRLIGNFLTWRP